MPIINTVYEVEAYIAFKRVTAEFTEALRRIRVDFVREFEAEMKRLDKGEVLGISDARD